MTNKEIKQITGDLPHMSLAQADKIARFISDNKINNILELGFRHGVSTCYMAAALAKNGEGSISTIDLETAKQANPNIEDLLDKTNLSKFVEVYYEPTSYTWRLMKFLEEDPNPRFDFCYLDGAHNWFVDGFAFFLVDRLLKPGGWIIFDDLDWTYIGSPTMSKLELVKNMPEDEKNTPQVRKVYDLLVKTHTNYHNFKVEDDWAYAQKKPLNSNQPIDREIVVEQIVVRPRIIELLGKLLAK